MPVISLSGRRRLPRRIVAQASQGIFDMDQGIVQ
jgi:hypothetical protein